MKEYQQKHMVRTLVYSKVTIIILFLFCVILLRSIMELRAKRIEAVQAGNEMRTERMDLEDKVRKSKEKNEALLTDRGFDTYVRMTFPVVKEGEGVIVVYDEKASQPVVSVREQISLWERFVIMWQRLFIKNDTAQ